MRLKGNRRLLGRIGLSFAVAILTVTLFPQELLSVPPLPQVKPPTPVPPPQLPIPHSFLPGTSHIKAERGAFSPDGSLLLLIETLSRDGARPLSLWDVRTGKALWRVNTTPQWTRFVNVKFSADGKIIASQEVGGNPSSKDSMVIRLRDTRTGTLLPRRSFPTENWFPCFALSPHGEAIALSAASDKKVRLVDTTTRKTIRTLEGVDFTGSSRSPNDWDVAFSPDGRYLAACPYRNYGGYNTNCPQLIVWETATGQLIYRHDSEDYSVDGEYDVLNTFLPEPLTFASNTLLVCSNAILDLNRQPLRLRTMLNTKDLSPIQSDMFVHEDKTTTLQGWRDFVGFTDQNIIGQNSRHLALFNSSYEDGSKGKGKRRVRQWEIWDIDTKKRVRSIPLPNSDDSKILAYSPINRLIAMRNAKHIVTLEMPPPPP